MNSGFAYVAATLLLTIYGQLVIKWQVNQVGALPRETTEKLYVLMSLLFRPWVITGFGAAFLAGLSWMAAMTKLKLSEAYPFLSLGFVGVMVFSYFFFGEELTMNKVVGTAIVMVGLIVISW